MNQGNSRESNLLTTILNSISALRPQVSVSPVKSVQPRIVEPTTVDIGCVGLGVGDDVGEDVGFRRKR